MAGKLGTICQSRILVWHIYICILYSYWNHFAYFNSNEWRIYCLTHWGRHRAAAISGRRFRVHFLEWTCINFNRDFAGICSWRSNLAIFLHWFRWRIGAVQATDRGLSQWWLDYWRIYIYTSFGLIQSRMVASWHQVMYSYHILFHFNPSWILGLLYTGYITILRFINFTYVLETMLYVILGWMCVSYCFRNTHCDCMFVATCLF